MTGRCTECGQFSSGPLCASHLELEEEARLRRNADSALMAKDRELQAARATIASQRRYAVAPTGVWRDLTWTEAVAKADYLYAAGLVFIEIRDERGTVIRKYSQDPTTKQKVVA